MTVSASVPSPTSRYIFLFGGYLCLEKEGLLAAPGPSEWFPSYPCGRVNGCSRSRECLGDNAEVLAAAVRSTTGCPFFPFLPQVPCVASYPTREHILPISLSGTFLHPTPACPRDFCIINKSFLTNDILDHLSSWSLRT